MKHLNDDIAICRDFLLILLLNDCICPTNDGEPVNIILFKDVLRCVIILFNYGDRDSL